jgi:hypothetical protein
VLREQHKEADVHARRHPAHGEIAGDALQLSGKGCT